MGQKGQLPQGEELEKEVRRLLNEGLVIWTKAEATIRDGGGSAKLTNDGFRGIEPGGWGLSVHRVRAKAGAGKLVYVAYASRDGWALPILSQSLCEMLFNKAAEKAL